MVSEDEMVSYLIGFDEPGELEKEEFDEVEYTASPESHYNHYGNRGAVDLFTRRKGINNRQASIYDRIYEVKSDHAIRESTGANEIIRQYNKHRKYFYEGSELNKPSKANFELVFIPSETTVKHVIDNARIYAAASNEQFHDEKLWSEKIMFRTMNPADNTPYPVCLNNDHFPDFREPQKMVDQGVLDNSQCGQRVLELVKSVIDD